MFTLRMNSLPAFSIVQFPLLFICYDHLTRNTLLFCFLFFLFWEIEIPGANCNKVCLYMFFSDNSTDTTDSSNVKVKVFTNSCLIPPQDHLRPTPRSSWFTLETSQVYPKTTLVSPWTPGVLLRPPLTNLGAEPLWF